MVTKQSEGPLSGDTYLHPRWTDLRGDGEKVPRTHCPCGRLLSRGHGRQTQERGQGSDGHQLTACALRPRARGPWPGDTPDCRVPALAGVGRWEPGATCSGPRPSEAQAPVSTNSAALSATWSHQPGRNKIQPPVSHRFPEKSNSALPPERPTCENITIKAGRLAPRASRASVGARSLATGCLLLWHTRTTESLRASLPGPGPQGQRGQDGLSQPGHATEAACTTADLWPSGPGTSGRYRALPRDPCRNRVPVVTAAGSTAGVWRAGPAALLPPRRLLQSSEPDSTWTQTPRSLVSTHTECSGNAATHEIHPGRRTPPREPNTTPGRDGPPTHPPLSAAPGTRRALVVGRPALPV